MNNAQITKKILDSISIAEDVIQLKSEEYFEKNAKKLEENL